MEEKKQQCDIELDRDVAQGTYSNLSIISHSSSEFIIDFIRIMPGMPKAEVKSRIILTPEHAKRLLLALQDNDLRLITGRLIYRKAALLHPCSRWIWNRRDKLDNFRFDDFRF